MMGRGPSLSEETRANALRLQANNWSMREIVEATGRSRKALTRFLANPEEYGKKKSPGRKSTVDERTKRWLVNKAKTEKMGSRRLAQLEIDGKPLGIGDRQIRRIISSQDHMKFKKAQRAPSLTKVHKSQRVIFSKIRVNKPLVNNRTIWSDEKFWNLDGPDGLKSWWHDLRAEPVICISRHKGGGGLMTWAAFSRKGKLQLVFFRGTVNGEKYRDTLRSVLLPWARENHKKGFEYQHDNATIHTAKATQAFFKAEKVKVVKWPAKSPDLNPIENLWGIMARDVYGEGRQYEHLDDLEAAIRKAWEAIPQSRLDALLNSMDNRYFECISRHGNKTSY
jgi:transposase